MIRYPVFIVCLIIFFLYHTKVNAEFKKLLYNFEFVLYNFVRIGLEMPVKSIQN